MEQLIKYNILARMVMWLNNFGEGEGLDRELFHQTYGARMGDHYYAKWISTYQRNILKMVGYFGQNNTDGKKFIAMVESQMLKYEGGATEISDELRIPEEEGHVIDVFLQRDTQPYIAKRKELIEQAGMSEEEVDSWLRTSPIQLEIFYTNVGLFGVESEALDSCEIYNPYTGVEIPNDNLSN